MLTQATNILRRVVQAIPYVNAARERRYARSFLRPELHGSFLGVFRSFAEAAAAVPKSTPVGLDDDAYASIYDERLDRIYPYDYPNLFWLSPLIKAGANVFDFGGHVGVTYHGYRRYLPEIAKVRWRVCDLPRVVARGREIAALRNAPETLEFTTMPQEADGFDVFFAAGVLQYIERPGLAELLESLPRPPGHLFINKLPLSVGPTFVTLQNAKVTAAPQWIFNDAQFMSSIQRLGYELVDRWEDRVHSCRIPFHHDHDLPWYTGLYFKRAAAPSLASR